MKRMSKLEGFHVARELRRKEEDKVKNHLEKVCLSLAPFCFLWFGDVDVFWKNACRKSGCRRKNFGALSKFPKYQEIPKSAGLVYLHAWGQRECWLGNVCCPILVWTGDTTDGQVLIYTFTWSCKKISGGREIRHTQRWEEDESDVQKQRDRNRQKDI